MVYRKRRNSHTAKRKNLYPMGKFSQVNTHTPTPNTQHPETMTKQQEIQAWQKFAETMPPASTYTGEWLRGQIPFIADAIHSDLPPEIRAACMADAAHATTAARADALATRAAAHRDAETIREQAKADAQEIRNDAHTRAAHIIAAPAAALRAALRTLEG